MGQSLLYGAYETIYNYVFYAEFLKPFLKGKHFAVWERGKFDFDDHFVFFTNFLKR